jgi:hypothetical protein
MPKMVKEVYAGVQYDFSSEEGQVASSTTRVFRIIKSNVGEYVNVAASCGVQIGQQHPSESGLYCSSYSAQYDGDSRMVIVATFNYRTTPGGGDAGQDPGQFSPDIRPANWSISTTLMEAPAYRWKNLIDPDEPDSYGPPVNPVGDRYEGVTKLVPVSTITVEQFVLNDPTRLCEYAGYVNSEPVIIGSLVCAGATLMFRGLSMQPALEQHGTVLYRGWKASYEFMYKKNESEYTFESGNTILSWTGWRHEQIVEGLNIINKRFVSKAAAEDANVEAGALALQLVDSETGIGTAIKGWPDNIDIAEGTNLEKVRGMVLIGGEGPKPTQRPCSLPIPLNEDGTPRSRKAPKPVLVKAYDVQPLIDFNSAPFDLRLT